MRVQSNVSMHFIKVSYKKQNKFKIEINLRAIFYFNKKYILREGRSSNSPGATPTTKTSNFFWGYVNHKSLWYTWTSSVNTYVWSTMPLKLLPFALYMYINVHTHTHYTYI